ncbi:DNA cytosine methyltransferase [Pseudomonas citronellolis]|uniref:DNA cytosine methyltransferase n=1 Tax=Pseudomonas citronellolis TaxID=53408 RepID=UPI0023E3E9D6|nr:DNA cytosine methyltransferase [Pseudomonas citronellolis]MDF3932112.1 DNA cytosine methyltransferase [Pseudomonas citronellolis]
MAAYYNEHDAYAAQWLRNLIAAGHIAPGDVDERSIEDVHPDDLRPYTQCHFFAGIGVWSLALRRAGWPDDRPVWTGSCPCQPFSKTGKRLEFADERHLWPAWHHLIRERRPGEILGEQVADGGGLAWLDLVQADLEAEGYAFGAFDLCSAGFGAPHIRQRLWLVANAHSPGLAGWGVNPLQRRSQRPAGAGCLAGSVANSDGERLDSPPRPGLHHVEHHPESRRSPDGMANTHGITGGQGGAQHGGRNQGGNAQPWAGSRSSELPHLGRGPVNGFWRDADWLSCRDEKWRPVEPGTFPLADGASSRVGRLRAYGNAINAEAATQFVAAYMEATA